MVGSQVSGVNCCLAWIAIQDLISSVAGNPARIESSSHLAVSALNPDDSDIKAG